MGEDGGIALLVYKLVLWVGDDGGTALLVYKYVLGVREDGGIPSSSSPNTYL